MSAAHFLGDRPLSGLPLILQAVEEHQPTHVFAMFSGGNDSVVTLDVARRHPQFTAAVYVDTGIALPEAEPRARAICADLGVELLVYRATENTRKDGALDPQHYDELVTEYGFPGPTPTGHGKMFARLKQRQFERLVRDHPEGRIMLISGSRQTESARRARNVVPVKRVGRTVWVAPLWDWPLRQRDAYLEQFKLPRNPYSPLIGVSGDCLCGAYAKPGQLAAIEQHFPCMGRRLRDLEAKTRAAGFPWGWEEGPPESWKREQMPDLFNTAFEFTCASCGRA
ncbi:phosphoadenosine phosphosulfate reductase family protein [Deinococcus humi]|uniref:3'-phosphoadenosine 5'-phosphosulfate sulfotransferase (PAPS reductase)/FAD synthetase n=1 Tax=Deinococcus humi TaxID=662880 RepID=A0A7W8NBQ7_9DEIO|nr:3'-phosphoadenosine 5'-phosphosulfate sulfotransferase (PAPS reductase)/FAD synthetase [Deinococcus humi]GGO19700.1 hypothetical protein GCM10008949_04260 [Deinococcus humi]